MRRQTDKVVAILVSDVHLSHKPPPARAAEPDWYAAMKRPLDQIAKLADEHKCCVVYAGDIFDDGWRAARVPPELINFAIANLPPGYAVPGQHDLPHHNLDEIGRSAYWTLCEAKILWTLDYLRPAYNEQARLWLYGYPWNRKVKPRPCVAEEPGDLHLAVVHAYIWQKDASYVNAAPDKSIGAYAERLVGFDAAVFGDNHIGFRRRSGKCNVINCGGLMPRKSDERKYRPTIGLLMGEGNIHARYLDVSEDRWSDAATTIEAAEWAGAPALAEYLQELQSLGEGGLDFVEALRRPEVLESVSPDAQAVLYEVLDHARRQ
jgi:hypothetical protein